MEKLAYMRFFSYLCNVNKKIKCYGELLRAIQVHESKSG